VRKVRQEANDTLKKKQKDGDITEDQFHGDRDEVQKLTDRFCDEIDKIVTAKQAEIMEL
jgi:ribosome recycling factor